MHRFWILLGLGLCASTAAIKLHSTQRRLIDLEQRPRVDPAKIVELRTQIAEVEGQVTRTLEEIAALRREGAHANELDSRLGKLESGLGAASNALGEQRAKLDRVEIVQDEVPRSVDSQLEGLRKGVEDEVHKLENLARSTRGLAETTHEDLAVLEKGLERDKDRMWRELVGPVVQLQGDDTVGSGVLLESEAIPGTSDFRTYVITAWHVVRDIQKDDQHPVPIPVTIYGQGRRIWPETAELLKYDATIDVALLKLNTTHAVECGARLATRDELAQSKIFEQIYAVGSPLGNDPIPTFGEIADTNHVVDGNRYWMISAPTYIGNSGGGIFDAQNHGLLGIFSKIYTHGTLRPTVVPHMGLVTSMETIYDWLEHVGYAELETRAKDVQARIATATKR